MRIIERLSWHRPAPTDPELDKRLLGLPLRELVAFAAYCAAENRQRDLSALMDWQAQRLPGRGSNPVMSRAVA